MKIIIFGYGKMGRAIEKIAIDRGHTIIGKVTIDNRHEFDDGEIVKQADVAIEFSEPDAAVENIKLCLKHRVPVLSGTTGWLHHKPEIDAFTIEQNGAFFYASNFSIGVNLFFKLNQNLAALMQRHENYKINLEEIHHTEKKDAPSGTAITLAEGIMANNPGKKQWVNKASDDIENLSIISFREPQVPGTHTVKYTSGVDEIEIKHTAFSREGFASGAVHVAEWLPGKKGVLSMDDFLKI